MAPFRGLRHLPQRAAGHCGAALPPHVPGTRVGKGQFTVVLGLKVVGLPAILRATHDGNSPCLVSAFCFPGFRSCAGGQRLTKGLDWPLLANWMSREVSLKGWPQKRAFECVARVTWDILALDIWIEGVLWLSGTPKGPAKTRPRTYWGDYSGSFAGTLDTPEKGDCLLRLLQLLRWHCQARVGGPTNIYKPPTNRPKAKKRLKKAK